MPEALSLSQKAAVVFLRLNNSSRRLLLERLDTQEIKRLFDTIKDIGTLEAEQTKLVSDEFLSFLIEESGVIGGEKFAKDILSENLAPALLESVLEQDQSPFERLNALPLNLLAEQFQNERPQVIALLLSRLEETKAAALLGAFEVDFARDVVLSSLQAKPLTAHTLESFTQAVEKTLLTRLEEKNMQHTLARLTRMIEVQEPNVTLTLLEALERQDKQAAKAIAAQIFTFPHLELLSAKDLSHLLNTAGHGLVAQSLVNLPQDKQEFYLHHVSEKAADYILEEMELGRPNAQAQRDMVSLARKLGNAGEIELHYA
jgi:flagellar motor switch protein FliG